MFAVKDIHLSSLGKLTGQLQKLTEQKLWVQVLLGLFLGIGAGIIIGPDLNLLTPERSKLIASWFALPGYLFLALIQMIVVPLVLASIMRGLTAAGSLQELKRLGIAGTLFFLIMTMTASLLGIFIALQIDPGSYLDVKDLNQEIDFQVQNGSTAIIPNLSEVPTKIVGLLPSNPLASFTSGDMLRIVVFSIVFGIALMSISAKKSAPIYELLGSMQEVCMTIVGWAMRIAPLAVFGLIAKLTSTVGVSVLVGMSVYVLTVILALLLMGLLYLLLIKLLSKQKLLNFLVESKEVFLLAFSTSSSAAVMPLTIKTLEENLKVNPSTVRFLVPLGATVNMSGTALYQSVATVFLASVYGIDLDSSAILLVVTMTIIASVGSPATPGASIVILAMMLENIGVPQAGIALLLGVDRLLDMCRTVINVLGDMAAAIIVDAWVKYKNVLDIAASK